MKIIVSINLALAFLLEVTAFIIIGYWGFLQGSTIYMQYLLATALTIFAIILWGIFAAPRSRHKLNDVPRFLFKLFIFELAAFLFYKTGYLSFAILFGSIALFNLILAQIFDKESNFLNM